MEWKPIDTHMMVWLKRPFKEEEIKKVVFESAGVKALGLDRFTMVLFQSQWETINEDMVKVFREFSQDGIIHGVTNEIYICLIPKKLNSCRVEDFRLISLVTSLYKIIAKVLSLRLREVLADTISESQGGFVVGRQILDVILVANEIVDNYKKPRKEGIVFKIDFEKAYDYVEWDILGLC